MTTEHKDEIDVLLSDSSESFELPSSDGGGNNMLFLSTDTKVLHRKGVKGYGDTINRRCCNLVGERLLQVDKNGKMKLQSVAI